MWKTEVNKVGDFQYVHNVTGETRSRKRAGEGAPTRYVKRKLEGPFKNANVVVDESKTSLGKKLVQPTNQDLLLRQGHLGSTRSLLDRKIFERDFRLLDLKDGSSSLVRTYGKCEEISRITPEHTAIYKLNPHLQQVFANGRPFSCADHDFSLSDRIAQRDASGALQPRTPYGRRQGEVKTVEHWGQRKLLLSEIEFLTLYGHLAGLVVYAGAAPGTHIDFLSRKLFPSHKWILVDPAPFDARESDRIEVRETFFTDEMAKEFAGKDILFICDIRSMDEEQDDKLKEHRIHIDMVWQEKWVQIMQPKVSYPFRVHFYIICLVHIFYIGFHVEVPASICPAGWIYRVS